METSDWYFGKLLKIILNLFSCRDYGLDKQFDLVFWTGLYQILVRYSDLVLLMGFFYPYRPEKYQNPHFR